MKKFNYLFIISIISAILILGGCVQTYFADVSGNIKYISAGYYLADVTNDPEDRLTKNAELIYTKMKITPKGNMTVTGVSFDAKLKDKNAEETFHINIYVTNCNKSLSITDYENSKSLLTDNEITLSSSGGNISITLDNPYAFDFKGFENDLNTYTLCIEFLTENNEKNTAVCFSLNDIVLLTE